MLIIFRKILFVLILAFSLTFVCYGMEEPVVSADCTVLIDADTAEVLYAKNPHKRRSMASTTKIMTTLIALESGKAESVVRITDGVNIEGTAVGLKKGDRITLRDLCYGMLLESGNDAAVSAAIFLAGSESEFSSLMNKKAAEIGMKNTNFVTASGLDDENHYSTAYDMALLGAYAIRNEEFQEICSAKKYDAEYIYPKKSVRFFNHNKLLTTCEGVIGIKTGFTKKSGRCLVSACERNGKKLVAVSLAAPDDWNDHKSLYEYGFSLYNAQSFDVNIPEKISVYGSDIKNVEITLSDVNDFQLLKNSELRYEISINKFIYAPVELNDCVGKVKIFQNNIKIKEIDIVSNGQAPSINGVAHKPGLKEKIIIFLKKYIKRKVI